MERKELLKKEWSQKNLKPFLEYNQGSHYRAWWEHRCYCGEKHEWQTEIRYRFSGNNCPRCCGKGGLICSCKSLEKLRPDLAEEWSSDNKRNPIEFSLGSGYNAVWVSDSKSKLVTKRLRLRNYRGDFPKSNS